MPSEPACRSRNGDFESSSESFCSHKWNCAAVECNFMFHRAKSANLRNSFTLTTFVWIFVRVLSAICENWFWSFQRFSVFLISISPCCTQNAEVSRLLQMGRKEKSQKTRWKRMKMGMRSKKQRIWWSSRVRELLISIFFLRFRDFTPVYSMYVLYEFVRCSYYDNRVMTARRSSRAKNFPCSSSSSVGDEEKSWERETGVSFLLFVHSSPRHCRLLLSLRL